MKKNKSEYAQANKDWLVAKSKEDGVMALSKGVYYKVLAEGDHSSATPTPGNVITAHYTGKTIDGKQFDSSRGDVPLACRLRDLIEGWIIAMQQMHIGGRWDSEEEFAQHLADELCMFDNVPESITRFFDFKAFARELFMSDYEMGDGDHVFRTCQAASHPAGRGHHRA